MDDGVELVGDLHAVGFVRRGRDKGGAERGSRFDYDLISAWRAKTTSNVNEELMVEDGENSEEFVGGGRSQSGG